jgi:hypothetical protein
MRARLACDVLSDGWICPGKRLRKIDSHATPRSLRVLPRFRRASFLSLSLSLFCRARRTDASNELSRGFSLSLSLSAGEPSFSSSSSSSSRLGWFSPKPGRTSLHRPRVPFRPRRRERKFYWQQRWSSDGTRHHHQYEYREHAFVGYTEKTKKTKKKCTDMSQMCVSWAEKGECEKNREYMFENCCCGAS